jgi:DHA1 family bicyclomycin/chloramphenicol resistance-like MFS transporter
LHAALAQGSGDGAIIVFNTRAPLILQGVSSGLQHDMAGWGEAYRVETLMLNHFVAPTGWLTMMSGGVASGLALMPFS